MQNKLGTTRFYKVKNAKREFFCALCDSPRQMKYSSHLSPKNYFQIFILSLAMGWPLFYIMSYKVVYILFINWILVEVANKVMYRKEIPCPYCGFDATWYRRDVKVARKIVNEFWASKNATQPINEAPQQEDMATQQV